MGGARARVVLVAPGLLGPFPGHAPDWLPVPEAPALETLLARAARARDTVGLETLLLESFGLSPDRARGLPIAPLTRWADTGAPDAGPWVRADPVHLRADQQQLLLFDDHVLAVTGDEARDLTTGLSELYADRGWRFEAPAPGRWYLRAADLSGIDAAPLPEVAGRPIAPGLPGDAQASRWRAWLTEVQMWLHDHPINAAREAAGRPAVNSLWLWGAGELPAAPPARWSGVVSDEPLARGLARLTGVPEAAPTARAEAWLAGIGPGDHLLVLEATRAPALYGDAQAWGEAVARLEAEWVAPLMAALREGRVGELTVRCADGRQWRLSRLRARLPRRRGGRVARLATETT